MDKEKQIEEMATIMCGNDCEECARESAEFYRQTIEEARKNSCLLKNCAKELYNANYRKINEDEIVIPKEISVYDSIESGIKVFATNLGEKVEFTNNQILFLTKLWHFHDQQRKETAREILTAISEERYSYWDSCNCGKDETYWRNGSIEGTLQELAKKYGVDLGEEK